MYYYYHIFLQYHDDIIIKVHFSIYAMQLLKYLLETLIGMKMTMILLHQMDQFNIHRLDQTILTPVQP